MQTIIIILVYTFKWSQNHLPNSPQLNFSSIIGGIVKLRPDPNFIAISIRIDAHDVFHNTVKQMSHFMLERSTEASRISPLSGCAWMQIVFCAQSYERGCNDVVWFHNPGALIKGQTALCCTAEDKWKASGTAAEVELGSSTILPDSSGRGTSCHNTEDPWGRIGMESDNK